ncbi:hypothetical protein AGMMS49949_03060 [Alphaproteobacteria bacterium]|nr:hypothetical protein AGMMS49949_03060 [Alphaproteobacteria bacterium]GHS97960.1 hypothetical protein AGMMS50296_5330 [Alphaproteobacteria bacterium]
MKLRFGETAQALLNQEGKDTGTVRFTEKDATIVANFRKKVDWDQQKLSDVFEKYPEIRPEIKCTYSVEEKRYGQLPAEFRNLLDPARFVKIASYEFTLKTEEEDNDEF